MSWPAATAGLLLGAGLPIPPTGQPLRRPEPLRDRRALETLPTLDEVFLDATGRTRERLAGEVQEVLG